MAWRALRARPMRTALTTAGVALGVAVLFAGLATNAGIDAAIQRTVTNTIGRADLRLQAFGATGGSADTQTAAAGTSGVDIVAPALERRTYLEVGLAAANAPLPP